MANINRVDVIKILGVTVANTLSVHEHVSNVISLLWTQNITLGLNPTTLSSPQRTDLSLNVIL